MYRFGMYLVLLMVAASFVIAEEIFLSRDAQNTQVRITQDNLKSREQASLTLECHVQSFITTDLETPAGRFTRVYVEQGQYTNQPGEPELPMVNQIIEVPMGGEVSIRLISSEKIESEAKMYGINYPIFPHQPSVRKDQTEVPFLYERAAYQQSFRNVSIVSVEEMGVMRSARLVLVKFMPVEYSPVDGKIIIHNNIQAEVTVQNVNWEATQELKGNVSTEFQFIYNHVLAPASLQCTPREDAVKGYLIVADKAFENHGALKEFIAHKQGLKYQVTALYFSAPASVAAVEEAIKAEYIKTKPVFLLIIGDHGQIPGKQCGSQVSDLYYHSTLVGGSTDRLPDMLCGRFSATNADELTVQIRKTVRYENKTFADATYLNKYALVAGWDSSWAKRRGHPQINYAVNYYFNDTKGYVKPIKDMDAPDRNVFLTSKSQENTSRIVALISEGVGFYNYTAHGSQTNFSDPSFTISNVNSLTNTDKYVFVVGNCCLTGSFQIATCFGEAWLRAPDKGAIGFVGGSNYTYWDEDLWFGNGHYTFDSDTELGKAPPKEKTKPGMYDAAFGEFSSTTGNPDIRITCNAATMVAGNLAVEISSSSRKEYYWQVYHLFGDPSLPCYWAHQ